jgi:ABC-type branched-subunit amino acid transport system substrate-binding protein
MASAALRPQAARSLKAFALLTMAAAALSGCVPRSRPVQAPPREEAPPVEVRPTAPSRLPADETRNRIAVLVPLTGRDAALGQSILNAANLALLDTGGQRIRITAYDTASGAVPAVNDALAEGNGLILGPLLAEDVRAVAPVARGASVPVVAFSNDVSVAGDGVYLMGFTPVQSIRRVVSYARAQGASRFGALVPANTYGERSARAMTEAVEGAGGRLVGIQTYDGGAATGARAAATRLAGQGAADAVLIADLPRVAMLAAPAMRLASPQPRLLATERWATESNIGANIALRGTWFAAPSDANFGAFRNRYRARYSAAPYRLASMGYDAVLLVARVAADWPIGRPFPVRSLRDPVGFSGVDGAFRFGRDGIAERALEVREVNATGTTTVSPAPRGFN